MGGGPILQRPLLVDRLDDVLPRLSYILLVLSIQMGLQLGPDNALPMAPANGNAVFW